MSKVEPDYKRWGDVPRWCIDAVMEMSPSTSRHFPDIGAVHAAIISRHAPKVAEDAVVLAGGQKFRHEDERCSGQLGQTLAQCFDRRCAAAARILEAAK